MAKKKENPKKALVKTLKKLSRLAQLERERQVGVIRSKTFGGLPDIRHERKISKRELRQLDREESDE